MDELVVWLHGVLDELERIAQEAAGVTDPGGEWRHGPTKMAYFDRDDDNYSTLTTGAAAHGKATIHIALNDPRSVLSRVEAERIVLGEHAPDPWRENAYCSRCELGDDERSGIECPCPTVRALAYGHRFDAESYRSEWAPEGARATT